MLRRKVYFIFSHDKHLLSHAVWHNFCFQCKSKLHYEFDEMMFYFGINHLSQVYLQLFYLRNQDYATNLFSEASVSWFSFSLIKQRVKGRHCYSVCRLYNALKYCKRLKRWKLHYHMNILFQKVTFDGFCVHTIILSLRRTPWHS